MPSCTSQYYIDLESTPQYIKDQRPSILFFSSIFFICRVISDGFVEDAIQFTKKTLTYRWANRDFDIYDLATYLADSISYKSYDFQNYPDYIIVLKRIFEMPEMLEPSSRISIATDDLLHWWLCIWWRYYHAMTPENQDTNLSRYPNMFKPYGIAYYQVKSVDEIIHLARASIFVSKLEISDRTFPTIDLFWNEMTELGILSSIDQHRLIDLYFDVAIRALYYSQLEYVLEAIRLATHHTRFQNVIRWGRFGISLMGYLARKLTRQV
jgi:hypothetical protein